ncbi:MAG: sugar phosphate isomerase/epimerase family protein [Armatimonadota bacterium]|nr:sugar phosphate isomerase/epimerase family protein [Armatimonadota bacterium]
MYLSVRDHIALCAWPSLKEGLDGLGFDAVELEFARDNSVFAIRPSPGKERFKLDTPNSIEEFRKHLDENKVRVSAFLMSNNFGSDDLENEIKWTINAVKAADMLGIQAVRIDAIMHGEKDQPLEHNVTIFADCMKRILDATPDARVDLGVENHGYQGNMPEFLDQLLERVGSPRVGITIDTGNFYWRGHPLSRVYEIIEHFAPYCKHTHAKNINYPPDIREVEREMGYKYGEYVSPLRDGDIDHKRVVAILKEAGYERDLCLEDESLGRWPREEWQSVLKRDADFFREII